MSFPIGFVGVRQDIEIRQGADLQPTLVTLLAANGGPVNLTGGAFRGSVWRDPDVRVDMTFAIVDAQAGVFSYSMPQQDTTRLPGAPSLQMQQAAYNWGVDFVASDDEVYPVFYGRALVLRSPVA